MREFDVLTLPPVKELTAKQIRALRTRNRVSQAVFAAMLSTSVSTVQKWEIGEKRPSGPSLKLLDVIQARAYARSPNGFLSPGGRELTLCRRSPMTASEH
jgi:DNA-binding transcriptional regulator YiaG